MRGNISKSTLISASTTQRDSKLIKSALSAQLNSTQLQNFASPLRHLGQLLTKSTAEWKMAQEHGSDKTTLGNTPRCSRGIRI